MYINTNCLHHCSVRGVSFCLFGRHERGVPILATASANGARIRYIFTNLWTKVSKFFARAFGARDHILSITVEDGHGVFAIKADNESNL